MPELAVRDRKRHKLKDWSAVTAPTHSEILKIHPLDLQIFHRIMIARWL